MIEITSNKERVFSLAGPNESKKMHPIFNWFKFGTFQPKLDKIFYFYQYYHALYGQMQKKT